MRSGDLAVPDRLFGAVALQLAMALLVGGTSRPLHVFACLLASLPTLYLLLSGTRSSVPLGWIATAALALFGLAWLQLVPLPPAVWTALPGRDLAVQALEVAGIDPGWRPIALDPGAAFASLLSCVSPLVLLTAFARLNDGERASILKGILAFALMSAVLGMVQRLTGALTPYDIDHAGYATGLFANRNHLAAFLACAVALVPAALGPGDRKEARLLCAGAIIVLMAGIIASTSRAGIALGLVAVLALPAIYRSGWRLSAGVALAIVLAAAVTMQLPALAPVVDRFALLGTDQRLIMAETTWKAAQAFLPWGSGWGSFVPVYMAREGQVDRQKQERLSHRLRIGDPALIQRPCRKESQQQDDDIARQQAKIPAQPPPLQRRDRCKTPLCRGRADVGGCVHSPPCPRCTTDPVPEKIFPWWEVIGDFP